MLLDFGAADDGQAARLAEAWAATCAAEYGTTFGGVFRLSDGLPLPASADARRCQPVVVCPHD